MQESGDSASVGSPSLHLLESQSPPVPLQKQVSKSNKQQVHLDILGIDGLGILTCPSKGKELRQKMDYIPTQK